ncbi:sigma 54-interacting transcriptional regulator [Pseudaquabacterium rugosum]|uniref:Sigma 54-interacting transcriptional regulator n=1 Tax=Pseudaquabacterium rugosum TaxID=2984194 RepID=A0ABU9BJK5_9BURK
MLAPVVAPAGDPAAEPLPPTEALLARLRFDPHEGRIWLDEQRMLLLHNSSLGVFRRELIASLGLDQARGLIARIGYHSGANDAELAHRLRRGQAPTDALHIGPRLHMLEGVARVEQVRLELDEEQGRFLGEFRWHGCAEAEAHVQMCGLSTGPVCWQQTAYASGYVSRFMGRPVVFRELQCSGHGAPCCVILGRPAEDWDDAADDLRPLQADALGHGVSSAAWDGRAPVPAGTASALVASDAAALLGDSPVVGVSAGFNAACHLVRRAAGTQATVLFLGESGVGKEVLAQALHRIGPRADGPFVAINCAAIPDELIESELFGVERGGYTGAQSARPGRFERAHGGTLFLDEIGILGWTAQGKLLRALQQREIERIGGTQTLKVDVRVVAATNLDLKQEVAAGRFREDLYYRLNVLPIRVPPLRERREDIPVFLNHFLRRFNARDGRRVAGFTARAIDALLAYRWPGNIRELENLVERGVVLASDDGAIDLPHLFLGDEQPPEGWLGWRRDGRLALTHGPGRRPDAGADERAADPRGEGPGAGGVSATGEVGTGGEEGEVGPDSHPLARGVNRLLRAAQGHGPCAGRIEPVALDDLEQALVRSAMAATGGNQSAAARLLGLSRSQLIYRLKQTGPAGARG